MKLGELRVLHMYSIQRNTGARVRGPKGERSIAFDEFHRLPGSSPHLDTTLAAEELILSIDLPPFGYSENSHYLKVRDRASYAFALVSAAAALDMDGGRIRSVRLALGGVAHKPWRAKAAEQELMGKDVSIANFKAAADQELRQAKPYSHNRFKIEMVKQAIVRSLSIAGGLV